MSKIKRIRRWLRRKLWRKKRVDSRLGYGMTPMDSGSGSGLTQRASGMGPRSGSGMTAQRGRRKRRLRSVLILIQESRG